MTAGSRQPSVPGARAVESELGDAPAVVRKERRERLSMQGQPVFHPLPSHDVISSSRFDLGHWISARALWRRYCPGSRVSLAVCVLNESMPEEKCTGTIEASPVPPDGRWWLGGWWHGRWTLEKRKKEKARMVRAGGQILRIYRGLRP